MFFVNDLKRNQFKGMLQLTLWVEWCLSIRGLVFQLLATVPTTTYKKKYRIMFSYWIILITRHHSLTCNSQNTKTLEFTFARADGNLRHRRREMLRIPTYFCYPTWQKHNYVRGLTTCFWNTKLNSATESLAGILDGDQDSSAVDKRLF